MAPCTCLAHALLTVLITLCNDQHVRQSPYHNDGLLKGTLSWCPREAGKCLRNEGGTEKTKYSSGGFLKQVVVNLSVKGVGIFGWYFSFKEIKALLGS